MNTEQRQQGASAWITTRPIEGKGYMLNKQELWDFFNITYGWPLSQN